MDLIHGKLKPKFFIFIPFWDKKEGVLAEADGIEMGELGELDAVEEEREEEEDIMAVLAHARHNNKLIGSL